MKKLFIQVFVMFLMIIDFTSANQLPDSFSPMIPSPVIPQRIDDMTNPPMSAHEEALEQYLKFKSQPKLLKAASVNESDILPHIYMLHVNGINTPKKSAQDNMVALMNYSQVTGTKFGNSDYVLWNFVYNPTGTTHDNIFLDEAHGLISLFENLADTSWQKLWDTSDRSKITFDEYVKGNIASRGLPVVESQIQKYSNDPKIIERYQDYVKFRGGFNTSEVLDDFHKKVPYKFASVMKLLGDGNVKASNGDYSKSNDAIVLIPHSQGNLYANTLSLYLTSEKINKNHIGIFGVASPTEDNYSPVWFFSASNIFNQYLPNDKVKYYITSCHDGVINTLRVHNSTILNTLRYIVSFGTVGFYGVFDCNCDVPSSGHSLIDYYLTEPVLKKKVILGVNEVAYSVDMSLMASMTYNMTPYSISDRSSEYGGYKPYKYYPMVYSTVFGYNKYVPQILGLQQFDTNWNRYVEKIWDKDYDFEKNSNGLIVLKTPLLDQEIEKYPDDTQGKYPPAVYHLAAVVNGNMFSGGYDPRVVYNMYEDINDKDNTVDYRIIMHPYNEYSDNLMYETLRGSYAYFVNNGVDEPYCYISHQTNIWYFPFFSSVSSVRSDVHRTYPQIGFAGGRHFMPNSPDQKDIEKCISMGAKSDLIAGKYLSDGYFYNWAYSD